VATVNAGTRMASQGQRGRSFQAYSMMKAKVAKASPSASHLRNRVALSMRHPKNVCRAQLTSACSPAEDQMLDDFENTLPKASPAMVARIM